MSGKIKCTFEKCYQRFPSVEAMKKHKAKEALQATEDEVHDFYCKKCDEDCTDDVEYLIHQIQSPKHIVCPACGIEFKSEGGRDRHVSITHRQKQKLKCPGCKEMFTDAAGLMGHIEDNKCKIIGRDDFHRHRAEQQIEKDALEELQGGMLHAPPTISSHSDSDPQGGASLLEDHRVHVARDWRGEPQEDSWATDSQTEPYDRRASDLTGQMSDLAVDKYPPLLANPASTATTYSRRQPDTESYARSNRAATSDLFDPSQEPQVMSGSSIFGNKNVWEANKAARAQRPPIRETTSPNLLDSTSSINLIDSSVADRGSVATRGTRPSQADYRSNVIPPAVKAENPDPNAPNAQVQTRVRMQMPSRDKLQQYWSVIEGCYVCPGSKCNQKLSSVQAFEQHLLSGAHVGGMVQCPCCLKRFKTTTALVAHAESGSTRCDLRKTEEFDLAIQQITAGLIKVEGSWSGAGNAKFKSVPIAQW